MVKKQSGKKQSINTEKYIFLLLIAFYTTGLCCGCSFVYKADENIVFAKYISGTDIAQSILYFAVALAFKYSGILSGALYIIPLFCGIETSVNFTVHLLKNNVTAYSYLPYIIRDSAIAMLLILYVLVLTTQLLAKRLSIKKDIRYLFVYLCGVVLIMLLHYIFTNIIFVAF